VEGLHQAIQAGDLQQVDLKGWRALHYAVAAGQTLNVKLLLESRADVSAPDASGMSPLHWAAVLSRVSVVELLLSHGADVGRLDLHGRTPLAMLPIEALRYACNSEGRADEVRGQMVDIVGMGLADGPYVEMPAEGAEPNRGNATTRRPSYRRLDGAPFTILWEEQRGWAVFQQLGPVQGDPMFLNSNRNAWRCPLQGWQATEAVRQRSDTPLPTIQVTEAQPWRTGMLLWDATPEELRPPDLPGKVEALPPLQQPPSGGSVGANVTLLPLPHGMTIQVPAGLFGGAGGGAGGGGGGGGGNADGNAGGLPGCPTQ